HGAAFVVVYPSPKDRRPADQRKAARMTGDADLWEPGDEGVRNLERGTAEVQVSHPGPQDDGDPRDRSEAAAEKGSGPGDEGLVRHQVTTANITPSMTSFPLTTAWL